MKEWIYREYVRYYLGNPSVRVHIDAIHARQPEEEHKDKYDELTGEIVEGIVKSVDCSAIIATVPRTVVDLNRPENCGFDVLYKTKLDKYVQREGVKEYREVIRVILNHLVLVENKKVTAPYLHLSIHGFGRPKDPECWSNRMDFEIGTRCGDACSNEVSKWLYSELKKGVEKKINKELVVWRDKKWVGNESLAYHRNGSPIKSSNYKGYGNNYNAVQLEISREWRKNSRQRKVVINILAELIKEFNRKF